MLADQSMVKRLAVASALSKRNCVNIAFSIPAILSAFLA